MLPTASRTTKRADSGIGASQTGWVTPGIHFPVCEVGPLGEVGGVASANPLIRGGDAGSRCLGGGPAKSSQAEASGCHLT